jgi:hypothetical protein
MITGQHLGAALRRRLRNLGYPGYFVRHGTPVDGQSGGIAEELVPGQVAELTELRIDPQVVDGEEVAGHLIEDGEDPGERGQPLPPDPGQAAV